MELFVGEKIFGITVFVLGFITSMIMMIIIGDVFFIQDDSSTYWVGFVLFMIFFCSIMIALFVTKIRKLGIVICGTCFGIFICILLNSIILFRIASQPEWLFFYNTLVISGLIGALISHEFKD